MQRELFNIMFEELLKSFRPFKRAAMMLLWPTVKISLTPLVSKKKVKDRSWGKLGLWLGTLLPPFVCPSLPPVSSSSNVLAPLTSSSSSCLFFATNRQVFFLRTQHALQR